MRKQSRGRRHVAITTLCTALAALATAVPAAAQTWSGPYVGFGIGAASQRGGASEVVMFDTNLDGTFTDVVRTAAGADAFSPGFCGGIAAGPQPAAGCTDDSDGIDVGGRVGYDWQTGRIAVGVLVDLSAPHVSDGVSAFSTTPAFYAFSREMKMVTGFRGRIGAGSAKVLAYGTGGGAWARIDHQFTTSNTANTFVPSKDAIRSDQGWGYQAGGGVELRLGVHVTLTGEYLFTSISDEEGGTVRSQGPAPATNPFILVNSGGTDLRPADRFDVHAVRVALNYRF